MLRLTQKRLWMRVYDPQQILKSWETFMLRPPKGPLPLPQLLPGTANADAMAHEDTVGIGGYIQTAASFVWFSQVFKVRDFIQLGLPMQPLAQRDIMSYEILAQCGLVLLAASLPVTRGMRCVVHTGSHNTGAEAASNSALNAKVPACFFTAALWSLSARHSRCWGEPSSLTVRRLWGPGSALLWRPPPRRPLRRPESARLGRLRGSVTSLSQGVRTVTSSACFAGSDIV